MGNRTPLSKSVKQHVHDTLTDIIKTIFGLTQSYQTEAPEAAPAEKRNGDRKNDDKYYDIR